jgi:hypothetical protein
MDTTDPRDLPKAKSPLWHTLHEVVNLFGLVQPKYLGKKQQRSPKLSKD